MTIGTKAKFGLLFLSLAGPLAARTLVPPSDIPRVSRTIDSNLKNDSLKCDFRRSGPDVDFDLGYSFAFSIWTRSGFSADDDLTAYLRVTPLGRPPVYITQAFTVAAMPSVSTAAKDTNTPRQVGRSFFNIGEGNYSTDVVLLDQQGRGCHQHWNFDTGEYSLPFPPPLQPGAVDAQEFGSWKLDPNGIRLAVLIDAVPINRRSQILYGDGQAAYMDSLAAILRNVPCRSVSVVAFVLGEQRKIFYEENFGSQGFADLSAALHRLEFSTAPYQSMQSTDEWQFLIDLVEQQVTLKQPFDAVVFLGANTPGEANPKVEISGTTFPRFYYFQFYPRGTEGDDADCAADRRVLNREKLGQCRNPIYQTPGVLGYRSPDAIEHLTKDLHGSVFVMVLPKDLVPGIRKMREEATSKAP